MNLDKYLLKRQSLHTENKLVLIISVIMIMMILAGCGSGGGSNSGASVSSDNTNTGVTKSSLTLNWGAPTTNSNGTPLTDLAGFNVYYGTSSRNYSYKVDVGNTTGTVISDLSSGMWCFAVTAYDTSGNESSLSNELCKTI